MIRRSFLATLLFAASLARAQLTYTGTVRATEAETTVEGNVRLKDGAILLTADEMKISRDWVVTATGHVTLTRGTDRILADDVVFHRRESTFTAENLRLGQYPFYIEAFSAEGDPNEIHLNRVRVTYREPGPWQPTVTSDRLTYVPGQRLRADDAFAGVGPARPFPFLHFQQSLSEPDVNYVGLAGGFRSSLGVYGIAALRMPLFPGIRVGFDVGLYTARGIMVGPGAKYTSTDGGETYRGFLRSGFIRDHGDKLTDVLGRPIAANRGYIEWQHQQYLTPDLTFTGDINYWKDSAILRDFRPDDFFNVQEPDNSLESVYTGKNYYLSAFARFHPNSFEIVQQRLPEIRFDMLPLTLGGGIYQRFDASYVRLEEHDALSSPKLQSDRVDAFYGLSRPFAPQDWLDFTPVAGGRFDHYANTEGAAKPGDATRVLGEVGFDTALRASAIFDYRNDFWKIDGIRHLITPTLSYRYIPGADRDREKIPLIDRRQLFSTYLPILDLGDVRNLDDLHPTNTLRLGLNNNFQTRDPQYGSRDLLIFNVSEDFRIHREPGERDFSEIHTETTLLPASWLQLDVYESFVPQTFTLREFNSVLTLHDGNAWSVKFANNFLHRQIQDYLVAGTYRINERYQAITRLQYDARKHRFNEQSYGVVQNLSNTWLITYLVTLYSGRQRESNFGFSVKIDTVTF